MNGTLFYAFLLSFLIGTALTPFCIVAALKLGLVDNPGHRKVHKQPVARAGGLAFALGALISIGIWGRSDSLIQGVVVGAIIIIWLGSLDDYLDLRARLKLLGQTLAAGATAIYIHLSWLPFGLSDIFNNLQWILVPIIVFVLVMVTNAVNMSDGLDGLAGGLSFLSFGTIAYLAYQTQDTVVLLLTLPVLGGLLGFLRFNNFPARVFMGDGGSQFLGFILASSALLLTDPMRSPFSPMLALLLIGIPLLDLLAVTIQRMAIGLSPFQADRRHLHHKLLDIGFSHHQVVLILYILQIGLLVLAYLIRWAPEPILAATYLALLSITGGFFYLSSSGRLPIGIAKPLSRTTLYWRTWAQSVGWLSTLCIKLLGMSIFGFLCLGIFLPLSVEPEIAYTAIGIATLSIIGMVIKRPGELFVTRMGLYLGLTIVAYLMQDFIYSLAWNLQLAFQGFFGLLIILLLLAIHLDEKKQFQTNPMDYLLLFLALIIPYLPEIILSGIDLGSITAKLIILFFASEVVLQAFSQKAHYWGHTSIVVLLGVGVHAIW